MKSSGENPGPRSSSFENVAVKEVKSYLGEYKNGSSKQKRLNIKGIIGEKIVGLALDQLDLDYEWRPYRGQGTGTTRAKLDYLVSEDTLVEVKNWSALDYRTEFRTKIFERFKFHDPHREKNWYIVINPNLLDNRFGNTTLEERLETEGITPIPMQLVTPRTPEESIRGVFRSLVEKFAKEFGIPNPLDSSKLTLLSSSEPEKIRISQEGTGTAIGVIGKPGAGKSTLVSRAIPNMETTENVVLDIDGQLDSETREMYEPNATVLLPRELGRLEEPTVVFEDAPFESELIYNSLKSKRKNKANYIVICHDFDVLAKWIDFLDGLCILSQSSFDPANFSSEWGEDKVLKELRSRVENLPKHQYLFYDKDKRAISELKDTREGDLLAQFFSGEIDESSFDWIEGEKESTSRGDAISQGMIKMWKDRGSRKEKVRAIFREFGNVGSGLVSDVLGEERDERGRVKPTVKSTCSEVRDEMNLKGGTAPVNASLNEIRERCLTKDQLN